MDFVSMDCTTVQPEFEFATIKQEEEVKFVPHCQEFSEFNPKQEDVEVLGTELETEFNNSTLTLKIEEINLKPEGKHTELVSNDYKFNCHICEYVAKRKWHLQQHLLVHSTKPSNVHNSYIHKKKRLKTMQLICKFCSYSTNSKKYMARHLKTHCSKLSKCDICEHVAASKKTLRVHKLIHSAEKRFKCYGCDYSTFRKNDLKRHVATMHQQLEMLQCTLCNFKTKQDRSLKQHLKTCGKTRPQEEELKCNFCTYTTVKKHLYLRHNNSHARKQAKKCQNLEKEYVSSFLTTGTQKRYRCDKCRYNSEEIQLLVEHMGTHE